MSFHVLGATGIFMMLILRGFTIISTSQQIQKDLMTLALTIYYFLLNLWKEGVMSWSSAVSAGLILQKVFYTLILTWVSFVMYSPAQTYDSYIN
jgi:hypothetical protein